MNIFNTYSPLEKARARRDSILFSSNPVQTLKDKTIGLPTSNRNTQSILTPLSTDFNGNANLHALYPEEFEYYAIALELLDSKGNTEMYLAFPVMPNSVNENLVNINNIQKTIGGIIINNTPAFMPFDINISGTFGRKFKFASNLTDNVENADSFGTGYYMDSDLSSAGNEEVSEPKTDVFSQTVKTGYGLTKILKKIYNATSKLDTFNKTRTLILYNLSLNSNYVVEPRSLNLSQSNENNMMWNYNMTVKAVAPVNTQTPAYKASLNKLTSADTINKRINNSGKSITKILQDQITAQVFASVDNTKVGNILKEVYNSSNQTFDISNLENFQKSIFENTLNKNTLSF